MSVSPALELRDFGLAYADRTVLKSISFSVPAFACVALLGPSGTGKSTLVRTLAGFNDMNPSVRTWGQASCHGELLDSTSRRPALLMQKATLLISTLIDNLCSSLPNRDQLTRIEQREVISQALQDAGQTWALDKLDRPVVDLPLVEQRLIAVVREWLAEPPVLMLDEPTTGLNDADAQRVVDLLLWLRQRQTLIIVLHHLAQARQLATHVVLLASGRVQEEAPVDEFFDHPRSESGRIFLRTGSCPEESEVAEIEPENAGATDTPEHTSQHTPEQPESASGDTLAPVATTSTPPSTSTPPLASPLHQPGRVAPPALGGSALPGIVIRSPAMGPRGFVWLIPGEMAGTPVPGIVRPTEDDLQALCDVGIRHLVSLTEEPFDPRQAAAFGLTVTHLPIVDMHAPQLDETIALCQRIDAWRARHEPVAVHCRAGLGRTGTVLACYWMWAGAGRISAIAALEYVRQLNNGMVQSDVQTEFLSRFAARLLAICDAPTPLSSPG